MEPVSLILTALVTGAAEAIGGDAYKSLKEAIARRFVGKPKAQMVLAEHEKQPEVWEKPLEAELIEVDADKDEEIIQKAQELLKLMNFQAAAQGKYNINAGQIKGIVGDVKDGTVNQTIN